jgi:hypothetical protein
VTSAAAHIHTQTCQCTRSTHALLNACTHSTNQAADSCTHVASIHTGREQAHNGQHIQASQARLRQHSSSLHQSNPSVQVLQQAKPAGKQRSPLPGRKNETEGQQRHNTTACMIRDIYETQGAAAPRSGHTTSQCSFISAALLTLTNTNSPHYHQPHSNMNHRFCCTSARGFPCRRAPHKHHNPRQCNPE